MNESEIKKRLLDLVPTFIRGLQQIYTIGNSIREDRNLMEPMKEMKGTLNFVKNFPALVKPHIKTEELRRKLTLISIICYGLLQSIDEQNFEEFGKQYRALHLQLSKLDILNENGSLVRDLKVELYKIE